MSCPPGITNELLYRIWYNRLIALPDLGYAGSQDRSKDNCNDDLCRIPWQIRDHADGKRRGKGKLHLECKPCGAEDIGDSRCKDHPDNDQISLANEAFDEDSRQYGHEDESDQIAACRSGKFGESACESREYRKTDGAEQEIDKETDRRVLPTQDIDTDQQYQIRKRDGNGAYRNRNRQRCEDAGYGGCQCDQD